MKWTILLGILLLASTTLNVFLFQKKQQPGPPIIPTYKVLGVYDGDTFIIEGKRRVRLRQVKAPELGFCGGQEAKTALEKLIKNKNVRIDNQIPDNYGRDMGIIFVGDINVNKELIKSGVVRYYHDVTPYNQEFKSLQAAAEKNQLGIFGKCESKTPKDPACIIKGNIRANVKTKLYYFPGCRQYDTTVISEDLGEHWFCTEKEAQAVGFTKAETCTK